MEIVSWLTVGAIDTTWPGVSPCIADSDQAAQDAMDDAARQKLLVLVPALMHCADPAHAPNIESARRVLLAERSLSQLVPLVLEAAGAPHEAEALRASSGSFAHLRAALREAAEYGPTNPFVAALMDCAQKLIVCADGGQTAGQAQLPFRAAQLAVSVIQCNDAPARRLLLGERPRMRLLEFLEEAIITIIEEAIGPRGSRRHSPIPGMFSKPANASRRRWPKAFLPPSPANWRPAASRARMPSCAAACASPPT